MRPTLRLLSPSSTSASTAWETVIGLELHVQIKSPYKLFSRSNTSWDDPPNSHVSLFDAGVPGTLPTLSQHSVKQALLASLALNCTIPPKSSFDRKHYFYHDQPLGYQITQHYHPLAKSGFVEFPLPLPPPSSSSSKSSSSSSSSTRKIKRVRINQIQLEQDTAKTTTLAGLEGEGGMDEVLIDLNRAGTGLIEIVTEPDMRGAEEAVEFVKTLRGILRRTGVSDGDMEKGSLRVDCNVSVHRPGEEWGTRTEIKNVNSTRHVALAIASEIVRQTALLEAGRVVIQETRGWDDTTNSTVSLRSKEGEKDYRYMPDGNLPVVAIDPVYLSRLRSSLPELPLATRSRLLSSHPRLTNEDITKLLALDPETNTGVAFFESLLSAGPSREAKVCMNWVVNNLSGALRRTGREWAQRGLTAAEVGEIVDLVGEARLTTTNGNNLLRQLVALPPLEIGPTSSATSPPSSRIPSLLETHASLLSTPAPSPSSSSPSIHSSSSSSTTPPPAASTDPTEDLITAVLDSNPKMVKDLQAGKKPGMVMSLVGSVMKQSGGRADAKAVGLRIRERLGLEQP